MVCARQSRPCELVQSRRRTADGHSKTRQRTCCVESIASPVLKLRLWAQALRYGNDLEAMLKAIDIGFERSPRPRQEVYASCRSTLEMVGAVR